jgi:hypothetical protein
MQAIATGRNWAEAGIGTLPGSKAISAADR